MKICVVDDEKNIRRSIQLILENEGHEVVLCSDSLKAYEAIKNSNFDLAILDIRLNDNIDGIGLFRKLRAQNYMVPVIFISGNASLSEASQCVREGAYDFIEKPISAEKLVSLVERCYDYYSLQKRYRDLMEKKASENALHEDKDLVKVIGDSVLCNGLKDQLLRLAKTDAPFIHLNGDLGVGKRTLARYIHQNRSKKENKDFKSYSPLSLNKKMIDKEELQSLKGTILIENIEDLNSYAQDELLLLIKEKKFHENLRLISTSTKNLKNLEKPFSLELFYSINAVGIYVPNLLERKEDIPLWAQYFAESTQKDKKLSEGLLRKISLKTWDANLQELKNTINQLILTSGPEKILDESLLSMEKSLEERPKGSLHVLNVEALPLEVSSDASFPALKDFREHMEREYILKILRQERGNVTKSAQILDIERTFLHKKMASLKIEKKDYF